MADYLSSFMGNLYAGLDTFNRENTGMLRAANVDADLARITAVGQKILSPISKSPDPVDLTSGMTPPNGTAAETGKVEVSIENEKVIHIPLDGNETLGLDATGNYDRVFTGTISEAYRKLANLIETDAIVKACKGASRGFGDGAAALFTNNANLLEFGQVNKILNQNGCPRDNRNLVLSANDMANMQSYKTFLSHVNELGSAEFIRTGYTTPIHGFKIWETEMADTVTGGTGTGYLCAAAYTKGATAITVDTGTGTINSGDIITFGSSANRYVVVSGVTAAGTITIGAPGLKEAVADNATVTVMASYLPSLAFHTDAIKIVTRAPALPKNGDIALDRTLVTDPVSGLTFDIALYGGYHKNTLDIGIAYGSAVVKSDNIVILASA